jgi:hypothetical protein
METLRLRGIQQPSEVEKLLEAYVTHSKLLSKNCYRIFDPAAMPSQLQRVLARASEQGRIWLCWTDAFNSWLFTCEMSLPLARERAAPVLQVNLHGESGELIDSGDWMVDRQGKWHRCDR